MHKSEIAALVHYNFWANDQVLQAAAQLSADQFTRPVEPDPGWGNLRTVLVHTLDTEYGWRLNFQPNDETDTVLKADDFADVAALQARWEIEKIAWLNYLETIDDASLGQWYGEKPQAAPKIWQLIFHVLSHSMQHRSEAASILTSFGYSPGELNFGYFLHLHPEFMLS